MIINFTQEEFNFLTQYYDLKIVIKKGNGRITIDKNLKSEFKKKEKINVHKFGIYKIEYYDHFFFFLSLEDKLKLKSINHRMTNIKLKYYIIEHFLNPTPEQLLFVKQSLERMENNLKKHADNIRGKPNINKQIAMAKPEVRAKLKENTTKLWQNLEYREKQKPHHAKRTQARVDWHHKITTNPNGPEAQLMHEVSKRESRNKKISNNHKKRLKHLKEIEDPTYIKNIRIFSESGTIKNYEVKDAKANKIEFLLYNILEELNISYEFQPTIRSNSNNIYYADFLIYGNIVIEAFGDYWHATEYYTNIAKLTLEDIMYQGKTISQIRERDQIRIKNLEDTNYKVFIFEEHDINKNLDKVKENLLKIKQQYGKEN